LRGADAWIRQRVEKQPPRLEKATYYSRVVLLLGAVALVSGAIIYTTQYYVPFRLREIGVYTAKLSSVIYFIAMLSSTLTALVYGEVRRRLSAISIMVVVFAGVVGAIVVLAAAPSVAAIMGAMTVLGLSYGLFSPNLVSLVASATDEVSRPHAVGLVKGLHNGGPLVGPLLLQFVYLAYQAEGALYTLAGMAGVMLAGATGIFAVRRLQAVRAAA
jgi:MFS family permease